MVAGTKSLQKSPFLTKFEEKIYLYGGLCCFTYRLFGDFCLNNVYLGYG